MRVSFNSEKNTFIISDVSPYNLELLSTALENEGKRLSMLHTLSDQDFKKAIIADAEMTNKALGKEAYDLKVLEEELNDPKQLKELRGKTGIEKNLNSVSRMVQELLEGQKKLIGAVDFNIPKPH